MNRYGNLGPEMIAQGWFDLGGDSEKVCLLWVHLPSNTAIDVFELPRENFIGAVWGDEPEDKSVDGYVVGWSKRNEPRLQRIACRGVESQN